MAHALAWFEIPAVDFDRAMRFYGEILGRPLTVVPDPSGNEVGPDGARMATFNDFGDPSDINGAVIYSTEYKPSRDGAIVYLYVEGDLTPALNRVEPAGGKVVAPKTHIGEGMGYFAHFEDTEGNRVGLFSMA